jgi:hypothetical protein
MKSEYTKGYAWKLDGPFCTLQETPDPEKITFGRDGHLRKLAVGLFVPQYEAAFLMAKLGAVHKAGDKLDDTLPILPDGAVP